MTCGWFVAMVQLHPFTRIMDDETRCKLFPVLLAVSEPSSGLALPPPGKKGVKAAGS